MYPEQEDVCSASDSEDSSGTDDELPFKPYDIHNDGRVVKTASRCSRGSWRRPEIGWDVLITIHRFGELADVQAVEDSDNTSADGESPTIYKRQVEPADLQIELTLGGHNQQAFPQVGPTQWRQWLIDKKSTRRGWLCWRCACLW